MSPLTLTPKPSFPRNCWRNVWSTVALISVALQIVPSDASQAGMIYNADHRVVDAASVIDRSWAAFATPPVAAIAPDAASPVAANAATAAIVAHGGSPSISIGHAFLGMPSQGSDQTWLRTHFTML